MKTFSTGFLQVLLVSANTVFISKGFMPGVLIAGFMISLVWTFNVRAAVGGWTQRLQYCSGAAIGGSIGAYFSQLLI